MVFRKNSSFCFISPTLVYEKRRVVEKDGFPSRSIKISYKQVCLNDNSYLSSLLEYDSDKLQKDIAVGVDLNRVDTRILNPDHVSDIDLQRLSLSFDSTKHSPDTSEVTPEDFENI